MKGIIFAPDSGDQYKEFQREAANASKFFNAPVHLFPASKPEADRRKFVLSVLDSKRGAALDIVAFLCHGYRRGIQAGFDLRTAFDLALRIRAHAVVGASVPLYACSTGKGPGVDKDGQGESTAPGEGGFADALRDELVNQGMSGGKIYSHWTAGHLSRNPDARVFEIHRGAVGGLDVLPLRDGRDGYKRWRGYLHTPDGRWRVATMTHTEVVAEAMKCEPYAG